MGIPLPTLKAYEKTRVDLAIDDFCRIENPMVADLNRVWVLADVQCKIDQYRLEALKLSDKQLQEEKHQSARMAGLMASANDPRPNEHCHCHAIVSGGHREAAAIRAIMAWCSMRIDDPRNGCWLPKNMKVRAMMPRWLRNAVPHSRIHRDSYYRWLREAIRIPLIKNSNDLTHVLKMVRMRLQSGSVPKHIQAQLGI